MIEVKPATYEDLRLLGQERSYRGFNYVMWQDGRMVAAAGFVTEPERPGVAYVWTFHVEQSFLITRHFHKWCKRLLTYHQQNFERIECFTMNETKYCRWLERLGFECEGLSRKYFQGKDCIRFAWVKD